MHSPRAHVWMCVCERSRQRAAACLMLRLLLVRSLSVSDDDEGLCDGDDAVSFILTQEELARGTHSRSYTLSVWSVTDDRAPMTAPSVWPSASADR